MRASCAHQPLVGSPLPGQDAVAPDVWRSCKRSSRHSFRDPAGAPARPEDRPSLSPLDCAAWVSSMVRLDASARAVENDNGLLTCALGARSTARAASCAGGKPASSTSHITQKWARFGPHWPLVGLGGESLLAQRCGGSAASCRWSLSSSRGPLFDGFGRLPGNLRPFSPLRSIRRRARAA